MFHVTWAQGLAGASIAAGVTGTSLLYYFSDSQAVPAGLDSGPEMYARIRRRIPWVKTGYGLLLLSFLLQGAALLTSA